MRTLQACFAARAFATIVGDGSVVTWGCDAKDGGDSSAVQHQLKNVQQIQATYSTTALLLPFSATALFFREGGAGSAVQHQLKNVQQIQASSSAFAAILGDGSVVTWGSAWHGGDSRDVQDQLNNVVQIQAVHGAFAAILGDGSVVTWGHAAGGDSNLVQEQ